MTVRMTPTRAALMTAMAAALVLCGCAGRPTIPPRVAGPEARLTDVQSIDNIGAGQGVEVRDGMVYLYGDAHVGIIREYREAAGAAQMLLPTGRSLELTRHGVDLIPHPTGLTHHPDHGTWIGNTVRRKGTLYKIDWDRAWADGNLNNAVLHIVEDDAAVNGTRPEFVRIDNPELGDWLNRSEVTASERVPSSDRWVLATSDYGDTGNEVRLMDPAALERAARTSEPGVVIERWATGPWVQNLHWIDRTQTLVLVQNQIEGLRYRLTPLMYTRQGPVPFVVSLPIDLSPQDELEGFSLLDGTSGILVSASRRNNVYFVALDGRLRAAPAGADAPVASDAPITPGPATRPTTMPAQPLTITPEANTTPQ